MNTFTVEEYRGQDEGDCLVFATSIKEDAEKYIESKVGTLDHEWSERAYEKSDFKIREWLG